MYTYDQGQKVPPGTLPKVGEVWIHDSWPYRKGFQILETSRFATRIKTYEDKGDKFLPRSMFWDGHIQNGRTRKIKDAPPPPIPEINCPSCETPYPVSDDYLCSNCRANA
jgi:hypothetical protein